MSSIRKMTVSQIKERPILFSGPMVSAILDGRKTQTRRVLKPQPSEYVHGAPPPSLRQRKHAKPYDGGPRWCWFDLYDRQGLDWFRCPFGKPGDHLWVRETHAIVPATAYRHSNDDGKPLSHSVSPDGQQWAVYREGWTRSSPSRWRPSIHMPRWASRIMLEVVSVEVERVQDISAGDSRAEGLGMDDPRYSTVTLRGAFARLWDGINAKRGFPWESNPWVWVVRFGLWEDSHAE